MTGVVLDFDLRHPTQRMWTLIAAAGPLLFATAWVLTIYLPPVPLWNAAMRILPAGLVLLAIRPALPVGSWWTRSLMLGALNFGAFFACQAAAVHRIPVGVAATIAAMQTILVSFGATVAGERLRASHLVYAAAGITGIGLMVLRGTDHLDAVGVAAAAGTAVSAALGMLLTRRWGLPPGVHHSTATAWQMLGGAALIAPMALILEGWPPPLSGSAITVTAWLALAATALAFWTLFGALHSGVTAVTVSRLMLLGPLMATSSSWLLVGQALTPIQVLGAALVLIPVVAATRTPPLASPPSETESDTEPYRPLASHHRPEAALLQQVEYATRRGLR